MSQKSEGLSHFMQNLVCWLNPLKKFTIQSWKSLWKQLTQFLITHKHIQDDYFLLHIPSAATTLNCYISFFLFAFNNITPRLRQTKPETFTFNGKTSYNEMIVAIVDTISVIIITFTTYTETYTRLFVTFFLLFAICRHIDRKDYY